MIGRKFGANVFAVSTMYDAVFFMVLVSLSGVVLIPALHSNVALESSVEKHREELADEALATLMTSRVDNFGYVFAGSQIEAIAGENITEDNFLGSIVRIFLGKEQIHKTYADLCVENLVSQLKVFGYRVNIFTEDYDNSLSEKLSTILHNYLGDKYGFNLTIQWHPIPNLPFGGDATIGPHPPLGDTHVASSYLTMPDTFFSEWLKEVNILIQDQMLPVKKYLDNCTQNKSLWNKTTFEEIFKDTIFKLIDGILFDGFSIQNIYYESILDKSVDYVFEKINGTLASVFGNALNRTGEFFDILGINLGDSISNTLITSIGTFGFNISDFNNNSKIDVNDALFGLKNYVRVQAKTFLNNTLNEYIYDFVGMILDSIYSFNNVDIDDIQDEITAFLDEWMDVTRTKFTLTIWEVRG